MHISCKAPLPHIQPEVWEGGGLQYVKYKSPPTGTTILV